MKQALTAVALASAALLVLACGALLVCPGRPCAVPALDVAGLATLNAWRTGWLDRGFMILTWLGSLYVLLPAAVLLAWRARRASLPRAAAFVPAALIGAAILARLAKLGIERPRPDLFPALITMPDDASFPSAHAMQATALVAAWLLRSGARFAYGEALAGVLLVAAVAFSRVYLQVHFPSDVALGMVAALLWVMALRGLPLWQKADQPGTGETR
ncbi:MAG: phosphatase PAP2 family protein [Sulfuritalea sp.]|nr:phosphatase PAP2 family protein [Sulfuritalea sp.]